MENTLLVPALRAHTIALEHAVDSLGALSRQVNSVERLLEAFARIATEDQTNNRHTIHNLDQRITILVHMVRLTLRKIAPTELAIIEKQEALYLSQLTEESDMKKTRLDKIETEL